MGGKKSGTVNPQHAELGARIVDDIKRGVTRRDVMRILLAGGLLASSAGDLLACADKAHAWTPRKSGKIRICARFRTDEFVPAVMFCPGR